jgi:Holliday junction resolvasome RuvABC ATP-dependent DNA helicase subunit
VLLSGPPGIGKTTTAKVVSQMLGLQAIEVLVFPLFIPHFYLAGLNSNNIFFVIGKCE